MRILEVTRWRLAPIVAALLVFDPSLTAQRTGPGPLLDADGIEKRIGSPEDAKAVFALVFGHLRLNKNRELFLSSQIRSEWVPADAEQQLVRLDDVDAQATLNNCGTYWTVSDVRRSNNVVTLWLVSRCGGTTLNYTMHYTRGEWRHGPYDLPDGYGWSGGIGSGFAGGPPAGCPCLPPR